MVGREMMMEMERKRRRRRRSKKILIDLESNRK